MEAFADNVLPVLSQTLGMAAFAESVLPLLSLFLTEGTSEGPLGSLFYFMFTLNLNVQTLETL
jgi:hypothetical protein